MCACTLIDVNVEITYGRTHYQKSWLPYHHVLSEIFCETAETPEHEWQPCGSFNNLQRHSLASRTHLFLRAARFCDTQAELRKHLNAFTIVNIFLKKREKPFEVSNFAISTTAYTPLKVRPLSYHMGQWQPNSIFKKTIINRTFEYLLSLRLHLVQCAALFKAGSFCLQSLHSGYTIMEILKQYSKHVDWPSEFSFRASLKSKSRGSELWMLFWGVPIVNSPLTFWGKGWNTQQLRWHTHWICSRFPPTLKTWRFMCAAATQLKHVHLKHGSRLRSSKAHMFVVCTYELTYGVEVFKVVTSSDVH